MARMKSIMVDGMKQLNGEESFRFQCVHYQDGKKWDVYVLTDAFKLGSLYWQIGTIPYLAREANYKLYARAMDFVESYKQQFAAGC